MSDFIMTAEEFVDKLCYIADNLTTVYAWGTFGWPGSVSNKDRAIKKSTSSAMTKRIKQLPRDGYMFDCGGLVKSVLGGFCANPSVAYGGCHVYNVNGHLVYGDQKLVPETNDLIGYCTGVTTDFSILKAGELLYMPGHVGVVVDPVRGLVIECTDAWQHCVMYSHIKGFAKTGLPSDKYERKWTSHGMLPWIKYPDYKTKCPYCGKEF